jgi:hypothetical protein
VSTRERHTGASGASAGRADLTSAVATGCAGSATRESTGEYLDDATITTKVKAAFIKDPLVKALDVKVDKHTLINIKGSDKRLVGQVAANLRAIKPPDVYKQKGVRYVGEVLRKKEGKTGK